MSVNAPDSGKDMEDHEKFIKEITKILQEAVEQEPGIFTAQVT